MAWDSNTAERSGDDLVLNGHQRFITNGSVADFLIVMCVTDPSVHARQGSGSPGSSTRRR